MNQYFQTNTNHAWKKSTEKITKVISKMDQESFAIDPRRNVDKTEKETIWDGSMYHKDFSSEKFRQDILGNVCIKNVLYHKNKEQSKFSFHYEHILAHCKGGKSDINNVCLLNAGINMSKSSTGLYQVNFNEICGLKYRYGISFEDLLFKLERNLHETCIKYDIYFFKNKYHIWDTIIGYNNQNKLNQERPRDLEMVGYDENHEINKTIVCAMATTVVIGYATKKIYDNFVAPQPAPNIKPKKEPEPAPEESWGSWIGSALSVTGMIIVAGISIVLVSNTVSKPIRNNHR